MTSASEMVRSALLGPGDEFCPGLPEPAWAYVARLREFADADRGGVFKQVEGLVDSDPAGRTLLAGSVGRAVLTLLFSRGVLSQESVEENVLFDYLGRLALERSDRFRFAAANWPGAFGLDAGVLQRVADAGRLTGPQLAALALHRQPAGSALAAALRACQGLADGAGVPLDSDVLLALVRFGEQPMAADFFDLWRVIRERRSGSGRGPGDAAAKVRQALAPGRGSVAQVPPEPQVPASEFSPTGVSLRCSAAARRTWRSRMQAARAWRPAAPRSFLGRLSRYVGLLWDAMTDTWHLDRTFATWLEAAVQEPLLSRVWWHFTPPFFKGAGTGSVRFKDAAVLWCLGHPPPGSADCSRNVAALMEAIHRSWPWRSCLPARLICRLARSLGRCRSGEELVVICLEASLTWDRGRLVGLRERLAALLELESAGGSSRLRRLLRKAIACCSR